jgi:hypothetical protein
MTGLALKQSCFSAACPGLLRRRTFARKGCTANIYEMACRLIAFCRLTSRREPRELLLLVCPRFIEQLELPYAGRRGGRDDI